MNLSSSSSSRETLERNGRIVTETTDDCVERDGLATRLSDFGDTMEYAGFGQILGGLVILGFKGDE